MKAKAKIEKALSDHGMHGRVWKGHSIYTMRNGWHVSNGQVWFLGRNVTDAVDMIEATAEQRSYV